MQKCILFLVTVFFLNILLLSNSAYAQYFNKYYTWASEKHIWPGDTTKFFFFY